MMSYNFSYPNILGLEIPDQYAIYIYEVKIALHNEDSFELIQNSIRNPIGMERFSTSVKY
jgi:hypothetical protein